MSVWHLVYEGLCLKMWTIYLIHTWLQPGEKWRTLKEETVLNGFRPNFALRDTWLKPGVNEINR
jgi:hypothetical protein